ncbi:MAG: hypothetical protein KF770_05205 [Anaerolineae bacterium]|nr:hypothetical protein [Anaerolineae bacterium]
MNTLNKTNMMQNCLTRIRHLPQIVIKAIGISWVTVAIVILLIPRPGITVAPGGCTSTSGECSTSIDA